MNNLKVLLISVDFHNAVGGIAAWTKGYLEYCKKNKIQVKLVDTVKINTSRLGKLGNECRRTMRIIKHLKNQLKDPNQYNIAHINSNIVIYGIVRDYIVARYIASKKIPIILHFHCDIPFWDKGKLRHFFLARLLNMSNLNMVLCESSKKYLSDKYNIESELVPNFVDFETASDKKINILIRKIIYTGRVSEMKGAPEIIELARSFPDICFVLVGKVFPQIEKLNRTKNVIFKGQRDHEALLKMLDEADVFLFLTHSEGFSVALIEAMARGLPCIVTDVGANKEIVSGGAGIVVDVGDIKAVKSSIYAIESKQRRKIMSDYAINKVNKCYLLDSVMDRIVLLYKKVLEDEVK